MRLSTGLFYGTVLKAISIADFKLAETVYASSLKLPAHRHESNYFCFVLEGSFTECYGNRTRSCRPSTLIFHPAGETHADHFHTGARCFNIQMNTRWVERIDNLSSVIHIPADFHGERFSFLAMQLYGEFRGGDKFSPLTVEGLMLEIVAEASRHSLRKSGHKPPLWLRQAREILDEQFSETVTLVALSETVGVHPVHLAREFRRFYHCTVGGYVRKRRIEFACRQMSTTDFALSDIAHAAGFFDQSHFARTFKRVVGLTPSEYRRAFGSRRLRC
ncbi:MAG: helix-turn-helix transcriptional regulator [Pyrinomonadaceae bacterium]|nr:helix-turn-helix transcriptional regulator [Pyrinomonadaceae bacterium]